MLFIGLVSFISLAGSPIVPKLNFTSEPMLSSLSSRSVVIEWGTNLSSLGEVEYRKKGGKKSLQQKSPGKDRGHRVRLPSLSPRTAYEFRVKNSLENKRLSSDWYPFTTTSEDKKEVLFFQQIPQFQFKTPLEVAIYFETSRDAHAVIYLWEKGEKGRHYYPSTVFGQRHQVSLPALNPKTTYFYEVEASVENQKIRFPKREIVIPAVPLLFITQPSVSHLTASSVQLDWETNLPTQSSIRYGISRRLGKAIQVQTKEVRKHSIRLLHLSPGITYDYEVTIMSRDKEKNTLRNSFTTLNNLNKPF